MSEGWFIMVLMSEPVWGLRPEQWDVIGTAVTSLIFLIAAAAAWVAYRQLRQSQATALDQHRPYVLVTADSNRNSFHLIDLVVENVGAGPARDVVIQVDPPLRRVREEPDHALSKSRLFSDPIPLLPPGFSLRTYFDSAIERNGADMPVTHNVTLTYNDGHGHEWTERSVIDLSLLEGLLFTETFNVHHVVTTLRDIKKLLERSKTVQGNPLQVVTEPRTQYLDRRHREQEEQRRTMAEMKARMENARAASTGESDDAADA